MGVNLVQWPDGTMGIQGANLDLGAFILKEVEYVPATVDKVFFIAPRALKIVGIIHRPTVAGTDAGAVTAEIRKVPSGTAITSGTVVHSGTANLKGTINTNATLTLSATEATVRLAAGDALALDVTGVLTLAEGTIQIAMLPL